MTISFTVVCQIAEGKCHPKMSAVMPPIVVRYQIPGLSGIQEIKLEDTQTCDAVLVLINAQHNLQLTTLRWEGTVVALIDKIGD
jgi:hypothetical protein